MRPVTPAGSPGVWRALGVTVLRVATGVPLMLVVTGTAAFALTRRELLGRKIIILFFFLSIFFEVGLIPYYMVLRSFGLLNTFWVYVIPTGFSVWTMIVMKTSFQGLPDGLTEAARMDGAGYARIFFSIVVPLSVPMFAVLGLFSAVSHWNDYFTGEFFVNLEPKLWPLQTFLRHIAAERDRHSQGGHLRLLGPDALSGGGIAIDAAVAGHGVHRVRHAADPAGVSVAAALLREGGLDRVDQGVRNQRFEEVCGHKVRGAGRGPPALQR